MHAIFRILYYLKCSPRKIFIKEQEHEHLKKKAYSVVDYAKSPGFEGLSLGFVLMLEEI